MSEGLLLINGIHSPLALMDRAISWARQTGGSLKAIFLQETEESEGYGFPSDLDAAQELNTTQDANSSDHSLIESNMRMLEHAAKNSHVEISTVHLTDPTEAQLGSMLKGASNIFASERIDEYSVGYVSKFSVRGLLSQANASVSYIQD